MNPQTFIVKSVNRMKTECLWAYMAYKTKYAYNKRKAIGKMEHAPEGDFCDLTTVAFNNAEVILYQIRTLKKFFRFPYRHTVFDNSTDQEAATRIKAVCTEHGTGYIRLPRQEFIPLGHGSYSHGIACNYLYNNYIKTGGQILRTARP